jgi:hypothetical protein
MISDKGKVLPAQLKAPEPASPGLQIPLRLFYKFGETG